MLMAVPNPSINKKEYIITQIVHETPDVDIFYITPLDNQPLNFDPGMFVMLTYVSTEPKVEITRAFSIGSSPTTPVLDFYIHMIHGQLTSKLENSKIGDKLLVTGPYGQFRFIPSEDKKVLFIAGGTGLAPMMSMLKQINDQSTGTDVVMFYSVRYPNEIIRKDELKELESKIKLKNIITVTRESDLPWNGERGRINSEMIRKHCEDCRERTVYICGPLEFVKAMKQATQELGINNVKVKADVWG